MTFWRASFWDVGRTLTVTEMSLCPPAECYLLFIYYTVYTHVKSFTIVKNRKCGQVTSHCRKTQPYRADLSLFLNVPVVTEITVWGRLFQTVGEAWQNARLEKLRTDAPILELWSITCYMGSHNVTCHSTGRYLIYIPQRDGRLSWPW